MFGAVKGRVVLSSGSQEASNIASGAADLSAKEA